MRIDFPGGVPDGCTAWLDQHVGKGGNMTGLDDVRFDECAWYHQRRFRPYDEQIHDERRTQGEYIPSITVKDPVKAMWFALRWSGQ